MANVVDIKKMVKLVKSASEVEVVGAMAQGCGATMYRREVTEGDTTVRADRIAQEGEKDVTSWSVLVDGAFVVRFKNPMTVVREYLAWAAQMLKIANCAHEYVEMYHDGVTGVRLDCESGPCRWTACQHCGEHAPRADQVEDPETTTVVEAAPVVEAQETSPEPMKVDPFLDPAKMPTTETDIRDDIEECETSLYLRGIWMRELFDHEICAIMTDRECMRTLGRDWDFDKAKGTAAIIEKCRQVLPEMRAVYRAAKFKKPFNEIQKYLEECDILYRRITILESRLPLAA